MVLACYLNAVSDAIDHGKGAKPLYELWHILKDFSYIILFVWIMYLVRMEWYLILLSIVLMIGWYAIYRYLRRVDFWMWDDKINVSWIQWIWNIKR